ncbi:hypothetical protein ABIB48_000609 [Arthrobacter sp. UYCu511]
MYSPSASGTVSWLLKTTLKLLGANAAYTVNQKFSSGVRSPTEPVFDSS